MTPRAATPPSELTLRCCALRLKPRSRISPNSRPRFRGWKPSPSFSGHEAHLMLQKVISVFGELTKADQQDDGTLKIAGTASAEVVDAAGEIVLASAMKAAIPGFLNAGKGSL